MNHFSAQIRVDAERKRETFRFGNLQSGSIRFALRNVIRGILPHTDNPECGFPLLADETSCMTSAHRNDATGHGALMANVAHEGETSEACLVHDAPPRVRSKRTYTGCPVPASSSSIDLLAAANLFRLRLQPPLNGNKIPANAILRCCRYCRLDLNI